jgi:ADP-heptose:LPS heptosyltransferase
MVERFDVGFGLDPDEQGGALMALARCGVRFGYALDERGRVMPLNDGAHEWWRLGLDDHAKRANRRTFQELLFESCELQGTAPRPCLVVPDAARRAVHRRLGLPLAPFARVVLLNTGGGGRWAQKKWTPEHYRGFARVMRSEQPDTAVVIAGGPEEAALNTALLSSFDDEGIVDGGCDNTLKEFAAIVELADLVVTSDSLALHMATALSRPVVALVGPTSPWELDLYGSGEVVTAAVPCLACYRRQCDKPVTCMERLTPQQVYDACARVAVTSPIAPASRCNLGA